MNTLKWEDGLVLWVLHLLALHNGGTRFAVMKRRKVLFKSGVRETIPCIRMLNPSGLSNGLSSTLNRR